MQHQRTSKDVHLGFVNCGVNSNATGNITKYVISMKLKI